MQMHRVTAAENGRWMVGETPVVNVHPAERCAGQVCVMHNPTDHPLVVWPLAWDQGRYMVERVCAHQVRHPDPDSLAHAVAVGNEQARAHDCDGCCLVSTRDEALALMTASAAAGANGTTAAP